MVDEILSKIPHAVFSDTELTALSKGSANARHARVKRALMHGEILQIRRGLYCLSDRYQKQKISNLDLAQKIYGPSCISLESALSYHGLIPEAVYVTTSVSSRRAAEFQTPLGTFIYSSVPAQVLFLDAERVTQNSNIFFMASPVRAICDYIYTKKIKIGKILSFLKGMRIDEDWLKMITSEELERMMAYRSQRVREFLQKLKKGIL